MPCEAPVMTTTFLSLLTLASFIRAFGNHARKKSVDKDTGRQRSSSRCTSRCFSSMRATVSLPSARRVGGLLAAASWTIAFHRELRRAIDAPTRVRRVAADRGHVDDVPRPSLAHVWQHCARHVQKAEDVRCKLTFNFDGARFLDGPEQTVARVVHENIDASELFDASRGGIAGLPFVRDIQWQLEQTGMVGNG